MIAALVKTPLSQGYRRALEAALGEPVAILDVNALQSQGILGALRGLNAQRPSRLLLPAEDAASLNLLPILQILALCTRAGRLETVDPELRIERFSRASVVPKLARFVGASIVNACVALLTNLRLRSLERRPLTAGATATPARVLYVNANLWFGIKAGGSIGHVAGVANGLLHRGLALDFAACGRGPLVDDRAGYVPLVPQRVFGYPVELNNYRFHRLALRQLQRHVAAARPDFVYQRLSLANFAGVELSRRLRIPLVTEYNGSEAWVARHWGRPLQYHGLAVRAEEVMLRHSHLVVTVSDALRQELVGRGVPAERVVMYPNCIDPAMFDPAVHSGNACRELRAHYGIPDDAVLATFVGTFGQWHGVDVLAQAIRRLLEEDPEYLQRQRLRFMLVGDGARMAQVRQALDHPLAGRFVTLTGIVPQAAAPLHLAASDILLSPHVENPDGSRFFGSPTKLFEYMAMGKAIVASDLDQIGEVLRNSVAVGSLPVGSPAREETRMAVLCRPGDQSALLQAIRFLAANPDWRARLGANARAEALSRYTWDRHVEEIMAGLTRVLRPELAATASG